MTTAAIHTDPRYAQAVDTLAALGLGLFVSREHVDFDMYTGEGWACVTVDQVGPRPMMHAYTPSPINDRLVSGNQTHFVEWVARVAQHVARSVV
jgi:hypothetical protein